MGHVEIDVSDIFILTYNLLPTYFLYLKRWVGFFNFGSQIFAPLSFSMWKGAWGIFLKIKSLRNTL
jgi:hypothetical protein